MLLVVLEWQYKRSVSNQEGNASKQEDVKKQEDLAPTTQVQKSSETGGVAKESSSASPLQNEEKEKEKESKWSETLKRELDAWDKHTKKIMKKKGGRLNMGKLSKLVTKRIVKKSQVGKCSSNQREKIQATWKKKVRGEKVLTINSIQSHHGSTTTSTHLQCTLFFFLSFFLFFLTFTTFLSCL